MVTDKVVGGVISLELRKGTILNTFIQFTLLFLEHAHIICSCCRKRTKKTIVKAGRKKAKTGDIPTPGQATPRTRAAAAREATVKARLEAEQVEEKARAAMEAAEETSRAAIRVLPFEPVPLEIELPPPAAPSGPNTRRYILLAHSLVE